MKRTPRDLAERMRGQRERQTLQDGFTRETFSLPRDAAREKARELLQRYPSAAYMTQVESCENCRMAPLNLRCDGWRARIEGQVAPLAVTFGSRHPSNHRAARCACKTCNPTERHNCQTIPHALRAALHSVPPHTCRASIEANRVRARCARAIRQDHGHRPNRTPLCACNGQRQLADS